MQLFGACDMVVYSIYGRFEINADWLENNAEQYILKSKGVVVAAFPLHSVTRIDKDGENV